jgi:hypothetical protein
MNKFKTKKNKEIIKSFPLEKNPSQNKFSWCHITLLTQIKYSKYSEKILQKKKPDR